MIKSIIINGEEDNTLYTFNGPAIIRRKAATVSIAFNDGLSKVVHFTAPEDAQRTFEEIADWMSSDIDQLVISI